MSGHNRCAGEILSHGDLYRHGHDDNQAEFFANCDIQCRAGVAGNCREGIEGVSNGELRRPSFCGRVEVPDICTPSGSLWRALQSFPPGDWAGRTTEDRRRQTGTGTDRSRINRMLERPCGWSVGAARDWRTRSKPCSRLISVRVLSVNYSQLATTRPNTPTRKP